MFPVFVVDPPPTSSLVVPDSNNDDDLRDVLKGGHGGVGSRKRCVAGVRGRGQQGDGALSAEDRHAVLDLSSDQQQQQLWWFSGDCFPLLMAPPLTTDGSERGLEGATVVLCSIPVGVLVFLRPLLLPWVLVHVLPSLSWVLHCWCHLLG